MPKTAYSRGGPTIPVDDGGTGAETAGAALSNLDHASTNHAGIPGAGLSVGRDLILPKSSLLSLAWLPDAVGPAYTPATKFIPWNPGFYALPTFSGTGPTDVASDLDATGLIRTNHYRSSHANAGEIKYTFPTCNTVWLPRVWVKLSIFMPATLSAGTVYTVKFGDSPTNETRLFLSCSQAGPPLVVTPWSIERIVSGVAKPVVDMGITPSGLGTDLNDLIFYFVIDYTGPTSYTISVLDDDLTVLYAESHTGVSEVPVFSAGALEISLAEDAGPQLPPRVLSIYSVSQSYGRA